MTAALGALFYSRGALWASARWHWGPVKGTTAFASMTAPRWLVFAVLAACIASCAVIQTVSASQVEPLDHLADAQLRHVLKGGA